MLGTTSACAENTVTVHLLRTWERNYLRVRGEYLAAGVAMKIFLELPPRARRIHLERMEEQRMPGTTSACAENTAAIAARVENWWNYLRVRGEYISVASITTGWLELPPRARRIHIIGNRIGTATGTTSACAENTRSAPRDIGYEWNYLRVRGEY